MDQVDQHTDSQIAQSVSLTHNQRQSVNQLERNVAASTFCTVSGCGKTCPSGTNQVSEIVGQYSGYGKSSERCPPGLTRFVCCADGTSLGSCAWEGYRGAGLSCFSGCPLDKTEIMKSSAYLEDGHYAAWCSGNSYASLCSSSFSPPPSGVDVQPGESTDGGDESDDSDPLIAKYGDRAKAIFESGAEQAALDAAATSLCRLIVMGAEALLDEIELAIPGYGNDRDRLTVHTTLH
ncbi:hypothetical protein BDV59DRAFT_1827 [Aspergillus ambiguus]|uniref:uncharacterized protein n=1 Tax=Aspergillus ambiguus TaxID=176160 RepID=UPI003CCE3BE4